MFYSESDGIFHLDGEFITVEAIFDYPLHGGGLNLAEIKLNFADGTSRYCVSVASFVALGDNAIPSSVGYAVDGDLMTYTTIGNTKGTSERLRVTVNPVPIPGTLLLLWGGLAGLGLIRRKFKLQN